MSEAAQLAALQVFGCASAVDVVLEALLTAQCMQECVFMYMLEALLAAQCMQECVYIL
jgi:hypothetical protein